MGLNQKREGFLISTLNITEVNRILNRIERRLDQIEGIAQNSNMHGSQITNLQSGARSREALSVDNVGTTGILYLSGGVLTLLLKPDAGIVSDATGLYVELKANEGISVDASGLFVKRRAGYGLNSTADGLALKKQAAIGNPVAVTAVATTAGADTINASALSTDLATFATEVNALKTVIQLIINALRASEVIAT